MELTIEGRKFVSIANGTFAHDIWITRKIREAGLAGIAVRDGETQDEFIERIAISAYESGIAVQLLGGLFVPAGIEARDWTPEMAAQTADFFGAVTDPDAKQALRMQIASALFYFFVSALASSTTSPKSGAGMEEGAHHASEAASTSAIGAT